MRLRRILVVRRRTRLAKTWMNDGCVLTNDASRMAWPSVRWSNIQLSAQAGIPDSVKNGSTVAEKRARWKFHRFTSLEFELGITRQEICHHFPGGI